MKCTNGVDVESAEDDGVCTLNGLHQFQEGRIEDWKASQMYIKTFIVYVK